MEAANAALSIMALCLVILVYKAGRVAAALWFAITFPNAGRRIVQVYEANVGKCVLLGLVDLLFALLLAGILFRTKILGWLGLLVLLFLICVCVLAFGPTYYRLGKRLNIGGAHTVVRTMLLGGAFAESLFLAPVVGQVFSCLALLRGVGALHLGLLFRRQPSAQETVPE